MSSLPGDEYHITPLFTVHKCLLCTPYLSLSDKNPAHPASMQAIPSDGSTLFSMGWIMQVPWWRAAGPG